jgi:hypothetical protein
MLRIQHIMFCYAIVSMVPHPLRLTERRATQDGEPMEHIQLKLNNMQR